MTPFGARLRELRTARRMTLSELATLLAVSPAYLSALEHGKRGKPSRGLVRQICEVFDLIWDDAEALAELADLSDPRPRIDAAGLTPAQTALANRFAKMLRLLSPETVAAIETLIDATPPARPRRRRG